MILTFRIEFKYNTKIALTKISAIITANIKKLYTLHGILTHTLTKGCIYA